MGRVQLERRKCLTTERLGSILIKMLVSNVLLIGNHVQNHCYVLDKNVGRVGYRRWRVCTRDEVTPRVLLTEESIYLSRLYDLRSVSKRENDTLTHLGKDSCILV
jgi:hypothetical protein